MIILEGADNSGKTTLAKSLVNRNPHLIYWHSGSAPRDAVHEDACIQEQFDHAVAPLEIVDRVTCISQQVYRDGRLGEHKLANEVDRIIRAGTIIVYCRPSIDCLMSFEKFTWRDEESEEAKIQVIKNQHIYISRYDEVMRHIPHIVYGFEDKTSSTWLLQQLANIDQVFTYTKLHKLMRSRDYAQC